ncbi:MAG TPA: hypothetical protein ENN09_06220 [Planctomycetes bacterium]|nr:hypothetical protein [Planctomycetota bacterium]
MLAALSLLEKNFIPACLIAIAAGLAWPAPGLKAAFLLTLVLVLILFFTALRVDFSAVRGHLEKPLALSLSVFLLMFVFPLAFYAVSRAIIPRYSLGLLVMAAMPAGMASTALAVACGGEGAMALAVTLLTSLAAPLSVPLLVNLSGEAPPGEISARMLTMLRQSIMLAATLLLPMAAAYVLKKYRPELVRRHRTAYGGLAIAALALLIWIAMSIGAQTVFSDKTSSIVLLLYLFGYSGAFHLLGYFMLPHIPARRRIALSVNTAYVNNALAIVFAREFFPDRPEVMLPAVLLELPMTVALLPLKFLAAKFFAGTDTASGDVP